ncbi:hypothetical protein AVEN_195361-1 [Araneus ventricosus]|uniref:Uncharacterized protein n=1 Tax=Araneus ventricosus TaxID=182803 RepID=A0A4Y2DJA2_ARAVE|nr:hypothetical protein AVEN_195361-1 [Araneus ventricosus]
MAHRWTTFFICRKETTPFTSWRGDVPLTKRWNETLEWGLPACLILLHSGGRLSNESSYKSKGPFYEFPTDRTRASFSSRRCTLVGGLAWWLVDRNYSACMAVGILKYVVMEVERVTS